MDKPSRAERICTGIASTLLLLLFMLAVSLAEPIQAVN